MWPQNKYINNTYTYRNKSLNKGIPNGFLWNMDIQIISQKSTLSKDIRSKSTWCIRVSLPRNHLPSHFPIKNQLMTMLDWGWNNNLCHVPPKSANRVWKQSYTRVKPMSMAVCQESYLWTLKLEFHILGVMKYNSSFDFLLVEKCTDHPS